MDYTRIQIDSIGIGLSNIYNLDLTRDNFIRTYLAVGDIYNSSHNISLDTNNLNHMHNLVVTDKAVGVNTSRNRLSSLVNKSLIVEGNIHCLGSITAESILLSNDIDILKLSTNIKNFNQVLNRLSSHLLFYSVKDYLQDNIYTTHNVTIGSKNNADHNTNPLKISRHCNNNISNIQFVIENNDGTADTPTRFSCGIIGNTENSPFHIITSSNMPIHFNISKTYAEIDNLYIKDSDRQNTPDYTTYKSPSMAIDINGSVLINLDKLTKQIIYDSYYYNTSRGFVTITSKTEYANLYVNGSLYSDNIIIHDYITQESKSLDSLYMRQGNVGGLSLNANQIRGGDFNKDEFRFNSNVYIGTNENKSKLMIYGNSEITDNLNVNNTLTSTNLNVNNNLTVSGSGICDFNNSCYFSGSADFTSLNCANTITTRNITITDNIYYKGNIIGIGSTAPISALLTPTMDDITLTNYINVGGQTTNISDDNYNSDIVNIYKHKDTQKSQYELYLKDTTITPYGSAAYIGHTKLNTLDNELDNSLVILTQYNTTWNNIYFYAGKNKTKINDTAPNLGIFENNKIGINTIRPIKTLDINGDMITSNYYIRKNNIEYECDMIIKKNNYNYLSHLNINNENGINRKQLNVNGGINSYEGYYEGNNKLCSIKYLNSSNAIIENANIGLGVQFEDPKITIPLKVQNTNINNGKINNSVISFYRSSDNSRYSGIEFCDDSTNINTVSKNKWYIYKNHISDDLIYAGPLQIGYMKNSYKPKKSCINLYYDNDKYYIDINNPTTYGNASDFNRNKEDLRITGNVKITGDIDIDGSINIKGNYKFNDNNILFSPNPVETIINKIYSLGNNIYYFDTILSPNHPKKISFTNSNLAYNTYVNILDDTNNFNRDLNSAYSTSNYILTSNNYELNKILLTNVNDYNSYIITTSNNTSNYISYINNFKSNITSIYNTNFNIHLIYTNNLSLQNKLDYVDLNIPNENLRLNALTNLNYSYSNYKLSSNIYDTIYDFYLRTTTTSNNSLNLINTAISDIILTTTASNAMKTAYANILYNSDINIITKYGYSNLYYSSNIYSNTLSYYNNISNINYYLINGTMNSMISVANISKNLLYNEYIISSNYYNNLTVNIGLGKFGDIIQENKNFSYNNDINLNILNNNLITYYNFYNNSSNLINSTINNINITSNLLVSDTNKTNTIYQSITIPIRSYLDSAFINSNIAYSNYTLISNISRDYTTYTSNINNIYQNSNVVTNYTLTASNLKININTNDNSNYILYDYYFMNTSLAPLIDLYSNSSNNTTYSMETYNISSNIYNKLNYINNYINSYIPIANNYKTLTSNYLTNSINIYNNLSNIYKDQNHLIDIANILITGNNNRTVASNIYTSSSNFYNYISNIKIITSNFEIISSNDMIISSNTYIICDNFYNTKNTATNTILLTSNNKYSSNILNNIKNIYGNLIDNYPILYSELNNRNYNFDSNLALNNTLLTTRIVNAVNTDINTYLQKSTINAEDAINLDLQISAFNPDYSSNLLYYGNDDEIDVGINAILIYITNLNTTIDNLRLDIINICSSYSYIFDLEQDLKDIYNTTIENIDYNINLLKEIKTEIIYISENTSDKEILLELILHITNKYINFINNSYNLSNSISVFVETLSNYIDIYINTSLSLIPLLNYMIEYANTHLNLTWNDISQQIVLFASLSYSVNSSIKSIAPVSTAGQNTDVLIIGNNIKIYPTKSLIIGHDNDYSKWLESINDEANYSAAYIYNNKINSCASSFNCKTNTFISSTGGELALKSSAAIDINLIDTLIKPYPNFSASIIDGVSLKISHIYHRDNFNTITPSVNNSLFEITRKTLENKPYFSCYTTSNYINIMNIGGGNFYDNNNNCINEDTVVHINDDTINNLLKLTNNSINPILVGFSQNSNINNWQLSVSNNFNYKYNSRDILSITSNGLAINSSINENASIFVNSFNNKSALELKNNYVSSSPLLKNNNIQVNDKLGVIYNETGIYYSNLDNINTDYDLSTTNFYYSSNITLDDITYRFNNVVVNYNNITDNLNFDYNATTNTVDLMPKLGLNDVNISYNYELDINYIIRTITPATNITIKYRTPIPTSETSLINFNTIDITNNPVYSTSVINTTVANGNITRVLLTTFLLGEIVQGEDVVVILKSYDINDGAINIRNYIKFYKYASFKLPSLNITLSNYKYNLIRLNNIVPVSLYNGNCVNTITKTKINDTTIINNTVNYLKPITGITSNLQTYSENKLKVYPVKIKNLIYNIPINININDYYYKYENCELLVEYVKTTAKLPLIKQTNIYNNAHNIYSFTDDYEIYLNNTKLLNINSHGTLKTTGNIETNNIYLKGDIYNSDGSSLYDNILSLINNISSTTNFELNTRNIILNPAVGYRDSYKGGILINGNNINNKNNNLFQINNFSDNDNFLTLNSCTTNSFIHFNNKITKNEDGANKDYNSIYKIGLTNETFGIWKYNLNTYEKNLFIDTNITNNYVNALEINYKSEKNNFEFNLNGSIFQNADSNLKNDIRVIDNALNKLCSLSGVTYLNNNGIAKRQTGVLAHQVNNILPEAVTINNAGYSNVAYGNLAGLIIESIKELKTEINSLKTSLGL